LVGWVRDGSGSASAGPFLCGCLRIPADPQGRSAADGFEIRPTNPACGKVAFTGERIIVEDVTTDPLWEPYCALAQQLNIGACLLVVPDPRSRGGQDLGTLAIYYDSPP
jgi:hypothetical protein